MSETEVKLENGRVVISDALREKLLIANGYAINVDVALRQLAQSFRTCNENMLICADELKKLADKRNKPKPAKPYWRTGERW